jgi:thiol-disulfide isomerase/thioredoxin
MRFAALVIMSVGLQAQSHWPVQLEIDVKAQSWSSAVRVGAAIVEEIDAGRMFVRFADVPREIAVRLMYAEALERMSESEEARRQRSITTALEEHRESAPGFARRLANLKADVLASRIDQLSSLPHHDGRATIVAFWASWCALCKPELDALAKYSNPLADVLRVDVDHLDPALRPYTPGELPQLYVVDPAGVIRFHVAGYEDEGFFSRKLDWMIDSTLTK